MKYYTGVDVLRTLDAQATHPEEVAGVQHQMERLLRSRHPPEADYDVQTLSAILSAAKSISLALTIVLLVVAFIALLISGIGIMNIMLVTVITERTVKSASAKPSAPAHREILLSYF